MTYKDRYDLIVIGSGPGGRRAAIQAAKFGKSVLVVERGKRLGGVSVHSGTISSKTLRETSLNLSGDTGLSCNEFLKGKFWFILKFVITWIILIF